jgi:EAL domain-containing protein (putative c-di-GMP-specific phosphodiesterase class I)
MFELTGIDALAKRAGAEHMERALCEAGTVLRAASIQGETAGRLGPDKLGFVHDAHTDTAAIGARITAISRSADPTGAGLDVAQWTLPLEAAGLQPAQVSQVLRYAIRSFAERGLQEFQPGSMNEMMRGLVSDTIARITSVKDTIDTGSIAIAYQPIVGMKDRRVHHWEALCRPGESESSAGVVSFAEQIGLSGEFDLLVCSKVIAAIEEAAQKQLKPSIAINLSAASIENEMFLAAFRELLAPHAAIRPQLLIEITESSRIADLAAAEKVIQDFRKQGHKVCLDDFGAGAAAFPYIQNLTVDYVKIDGAYVRRMLEDKRDTAILRAIVHLCAELKIGTVAEMIETEAQAKRLAEFGIDFGQGFLFGKPNVGEDFAAARPVALNLRRKGLVETWQ